MRAGAEALRRELWQGACARRQDIFCHSCVAVVSDSRGVWTGKG